MRAARGPSLAAASALLALLVACASPEPPPRAPEPEVWGPEASGLRCRVGTPATAHQGDVLPVSVVIETCATDNAPGGGVKFGPDRRAMSVVLECNGAGGRVVSVTASDPYAGMPPDESERTPTLREKGERLIRPVEFPLATAWDELGPGMYRCRVRVSCEPARDGFFRGALVSADFALLVDAVPPIPTTLFLPTALRIEGGRVNYHPTDAEEVRVSVRNGFVIAARIEAEGGTGMTSALRAVPRPDDDNPIDVVYSPEQRLATAYTITVFETADPPQHGWAPGPGSGGYREFWKRRLTPSR